MCTYLIGMRSGNKDHGSFLWNFVCASGTNLPEEDVEQDSEEERHEVVDLKGHDWIQTCLRGD